MSLDLIVICFRDGKFDALHINTKRLNMSVLLLKYELSGFLEKSSSVFQTFNEFFVLLRP